VLKVLTHQGNADQNNIEIPSYLSQMFIIKKTTTNDGKDAGENELSYIIGGNVN
jgi:hypothetical protein